MRQRKLCLPTGCDETAPDICLLYECVWVGVFLFPLGILPLSFAENSVAEVKRTAPAAGAVLHVAFICRRYQLLSVNKLISALCLSVYVCVLVTVLGYSVLSVTLVSAFSLSAVFVVPLMKTRFMNRVLVFFISLSIGTLYSTAVLQLLPEVQYTPLSLTPESTKQPSRQISWPSLSLHQNRPNTVKLPVSLKRSFTLTVGVLPFL